MTSLQLIDDLERHYLDYFSRIDDAASTAIASLPKGLARWHVSLAPGDALTFTTLWFHAVSCLETLNINVNYKSLTDQGYLGRLLAKLRR